MSVRLLFACGGEPAAGRGSKQQSRRAGEGVDVDGDRAGIELGLAPISETCQGRSEMRRVGVMATAAASLLIPSRLTKPALVIGDGVRVAGGWGEASGGHDSAQWQY